MKPQVSYKRPATFPVTDYNYQPTVDASYVRAKQTRSADHLRGFWKLGTKFHGAESAYRDTTDFLVFTLMGVSCTWPFFSVGMAIVHVFLG